MSRALLDALALVEAAGTAAPDAPALPAAPLPSLMRRCADEVAAAPAPEPVRLLHHLACTGGTVIARALAVMPGVTLLSEIDPLSPLGLPARDETPPFRPHDLIFAGRVAVRPISDRQASAIFTAGLKVLQADMVAEGRHLVLRDHAHSRFCTDAAPAARPGVETLAAQVAPVRRAVTVRHPMDSFLSLQANGWMHFDPPTLDAYAARYHAFLDAHEGVTRLRYEDFAADPEAVLKRLCATLELPYRPGADARLALARVSGDSGRRGDRIAPRPPKPVPDTLAEAARDSAGYAALLARLGYDDGDREGDRHG
ncbi:sulfotransferase [Citreimonas salinaria]|uniref:Sulfotransferase family protein n=1 Tax=Citreimonas salinaria TaxID=321339 RepID=A0A1H3N4N9_9RHOB|nr:sulfotransferase [Citreimonas salinaria]SDY83734.1 Sulfotransferase family protein [Citreimonas salinaria]